MYSLILIFEYIKKANRKFIQKVNIKLLLSGLKILGNVKIYLITHCEYVILWKMYELKYERVFVYFMIESWAACTSIFYKSIICNYNHLWYDHKFNIPNYFPNYGQLENSIILIIINSFFLEGGNKFNR